MKRTRMEFCGNLLVPVGNNIKFNFEWLGTLRSENNTVQVIGFKTDKKEEFVSLMEQDMETLSKGEPSKSSKAQIKFISSMLAEVANSTMVKVPEQKMLAVARELVSVELRRQGKNFCKNFTPENTIYTSGVSGIYEE